MKKTIFKSRLECPDCNGCGKMAIHCKHEDGTHGIKSFVCKLCNGNGYIEGKIKIEYDTEVN